MNPRLAIFAFVVSACFVFIGHANMYADWAQKNAVNLNGPSTSEVAKSPSASSASVPQVGESSLSPAKTKPSGDGAQNPENTILQRIKQDALSCKDEWSGSLDDLKALVDHARQKYGFENTKSQGRNATMLIPANLNEMERIRSGQSLFNLKDDEWVWCFWDGWHASTAKNDDNWFVAGMKAFGSGVKKYEIEHGELAGAEVVYDKKTGRVVTDGHMGTRNYAYNFFLHDKLDVKPHQKNDSYKYVGILFETDPSDPNKYYIVNGQTGRRMTWREAEDFPTTLSAEWKDMGLACVPDDAKDVIEPDQCRDEAKCDIDTSKLEELLKEGIIFLKDLIAKGKRATNSQIDAHNQRVKEILAETLSIAKRIDALDVSDEEKRRFAERAFERANGLLSQFAGLVKQSRSLDLVRGATTEKLVELIKEVQGEADAAKSKSTDVSSDSDFDVCKCANPDDSDFKCQKCGKMSKWLAPHRDKKFEQMLKRGNN